MKIHQRREDANLSFEAFGPGCARMPCFFFFLVAGCLDDDPIVTPMDTNGWVFLNRSCEDLHPDSGLLRNESWHA